jgi:ribulose-phosphate 3-epimerase
MVNISASLICANYARMGEEARRAELAGADSLHLDITDGVYVPTLTLSPNLVRDLQPFTRLPYILHLEVRDPLQILKSFEQSPLDTVIFMVDTAPNPLQVLGEIRACGFKAGMSIFPNEAVSSVEHILPHLDYFLLLAVGAGFGGQTHDPNTVKKVEQARAILDREGLHIPLAVDGGINVEIAGRLVNAGADDLIIGNGLFRSPDMAETIRQIKDFQRR